MFQLSKEVDDELTSVSGTVEIIPIPCFVLSVVEKFPV